jgi:hypothetical protein
MGRCIRGAVLLINVTAFTLGLAIAVGGSVALA